MSSSYPSIDKVINKMLNSDVFSLCFLLKLLFLLLCHNARGTLSPFCQPLLDSEREYASHPICLSALAIRPQWVMVPMSAVTSLTLTVPLPSMSHTVSL